MNTAGASFARWPLNYLATHGPRADPATALTWGLGIFSIAVVLIVAVVVVAAILLLRDRSPPEDLAGAPVGQSGGGMIWIYIGLPMTVLALFVGLVWTMQVVARIDSPPRTPRITLEVTGRQWWWQVRYVGADPSQSFSTANEIHIPTGQPILVRLYGADVIHSFWVPALSGKTDTIPGRTNLSWLQADRPGIYAGQCTEFCGLQHAHMAFSVVAQRPAEFEAWRSAQLAPAVPPASSALAAGQFIFVAQCGRCHAVSGSSANGRRGPDLTHLMSRSHLAAGALQNNIGSLAGWVADPQSSKPGTKMPATYLSGPQLQSVVAYLETLK